MGKAELCPVGTEIDTETECIDALNYASDLEIELRVSPRSPKVSVGSWGFLPYQCSYRAGGDQSFFFNNRKGDNTKHFLSGMHKMICKNGS